MQQNGRALADGSTCSAVHLGETGQWEGGGGFRTQFSAVLGVMDRFKHVGKHTLPRGLTAPNETVILPTPLRHPH